MTYNIKKIVSQCVFLKPWLIMCLFNFFLNYKYNIHVIIEYKTNLILCILHFLKANSLPTLFFNPKCYDLNSHVSPLRKNTNNKQKMILIMRKNRSHKIWKRICKRQYVHTIVQDIERCFQTQQWQKKQTWLKRDKQLNRKHTKNKYID